MIPGPEMQGAGRAVIWLIVAGSAAAAFAAEPANSGFPVFPESLQFSVNWPSGLSLGEGRLSARKLADRWEFALELEAALPGFAVLDRYRSSASLDLCSLEFHKDVVHGARKAREQTVFDYRKSIAIRTTTNGGKSELMIPACARDGLAFLFFTRRELAQGKVPAPQTIFFGAPYQIRLEYTGEQAVSVNERKMPADHVAVFIRGPASNVNCEIFFARDAARTPLVIRAPFSLGVFSMELVR